MLVISIQGTAASPAGLARLAGVLSTFRISATWGVATVAAGDIVEAALRGAMGTDLALDCTTSSPPLPGRELVERLQSLRQSGIDVSTLLCGAEPAASALESLARQGVRMIAVSGAAEVAAPLTTLRFGLWRLATSWRLPCDGWLGGAWGAARGRRLLDLAIRRNAPFHVMIDAAAMEQSSSAMRNLERLLRHVDRRRQQGMLSVVTLSAISRQLARPRGSATAHSILRERAA